MNERPYLSIGEVLSLLLEEFPDVTISKIRFLESQGLIEPERTPSGYRKFFDPDVERLRVILREQRENFLPLRIIRDRLESGEIDDTGVISNGGAGTPPRGIRNVRLVEVSDDADDADDTCAIEIDPTGTISVHADQVRSSRHPAARGGLGGMVTTSTMVVDLVRIDVTGIEVTGIEVTGIEVTGIDVTGIDVTGIDVAPQPSPTPASTSVSVPAVAVASMSMPVPPAEPSAAGNDVYIRSEVCALTGVTPVQLLELESFGLVSGRGAGNNTTYTDGDVAIVRAAAGFLVRGIEPRHLRGWRQSAEREASLFEQRILPLLRQRNPRARQDAIMLLHELAGLGAQLRGAIVASALKQHLDP